MKNAYAKFNPNEIDKNISAYTMGYFWKQQKLHKQQVLTAKKDNFEGTGTHQPHIATQRSWLGMN